MLPEASTLGAFAHFTSQALEPESPSIQRWRLHMAFNTNLMSAYAFQPLGYIIQGTEGNDSLYGGAYDDSIHGGGGNDYLSGGAGNDQLYGDAGNDVLVGGLGNDTLDGGIGDDLLIGGPGADHFNGGAGYDTVDYSSSTGLVAIDLSTNTALGTDAFGDTFEFIEKIVGTSGNDVFIGDSGVHTFLGAAGNDSFHSGAAG